MASSEVRRSKYLEDALLAMQERGAAPIQSGSELGARLLAQGLMQWSQKKALGKEKAAATEEQRRIGELLERTGATPEERVIFQADPEKAFEMIAKRVEPRVLSPGQSVLLGDQVAKSLPDYKQAGDTFVEIGGMPRGQMSSDIREVPTIGASPEPFRPPSMMDMSPPQPQAPQGPVRPVYTVPPSFADQTGRMSAQETMRHNPVMEGMAQGNLGVARGNLDVARGNLGVNQGRLGVARQQEDRLGASSGNPAALTAIEGELRRRGLIP